VRALPDKPVDTLYAEMGPFIYTAGVAVVDEFFFEKMVQLIYQ
jgi:hypothetical protein